MIEKNEDNTDSDSNLDRRKLISDKKTFLEKHFLKVQKEIKVSFAQLAQTLNAREKQLLRQSEALYRQQISLTLLNPEILPPSITILDDRNTLEEQIKQFGRIELTGSNTTVITDLEPYKIQEYQDITKDHVSFDKSVKGSEDISPNGDVEDLSTVDDRKIENITNGLKTVSIEYLTENTKQQSDGTSVRNSGRTIMEEQQNSHGLPEQVQQWLDQIVLETETEPTIHEVKKHLK
ncbi:uncharacterized protein LOC144475815 isoform X2 [Augochlora pura]